MPAGICPSSFALYLQAFVEDPENPPEVWAHKTLPFELERVFMLGQIGYRRGMRQFGIMASGVANVGIGLRVNYGEGRRIGILHPTRFLEEDQEDVNIAGQCTN